MNNLQELHVQELAGVSDKGIAALVRLSKLITLDLVLLYRITDEALKSVSQMKSLETPRLLGCKNISEVGILDLSGLMNLKNLVIKNCPGVGKT